MSPTSPAPQRSWIGPRAVAALIGAAVTYALAALGVTHLDPNVQAVVTGAVAVASAWVVKEEGALAKLLGLTP